VPNATLELITNATMLRYMTDVDFRGELPDVITRLQDLEAASGFLLIF
jgi:hypothetical protein